MFIIFVFALAFFAGTEIPLMSVGGHKLEGFIRQKRWGARTLAKLKKKNERLLITNLIATLFVTSAPMIIAEKYITPEMIMIFGGSPEATSLFVYIVSFMVVLLFGEITSKVLGVRFNDQIALMAAPVYQMIVWILLPLTWIVEQFVKVLGWITGGKLDMHGSTVSEEELDAFIDMSHAGGAVEEDEKRQIKNLLNLSDMTADSVMTPRVNVEFLSLDMTVDEVCDFMMKSSHSRLPVCGDSTDDVDSVMTFREAFHLQREGHGSAHLSSLDLEKIMKVSLTQALDDLFEKFQRSRRHIALVLDEHGGTAGVVTMEDVLEEVFGDIKDEKDREEIYMKKGKDGSIEAIGSVLIDDILEEYDMTPDMIDLPEEYMSETLSYVLMAEEEGFPNIGDIVSFGDTTRLILQVLAVDDNVIERVECRRK
ncbi:HlyC/CorC family transporter [Candidatus Gracilibacteria bacterium]|nr:HlyC/CorC family transporter [Candidatus Gracilibacteria bacterium]